MSCQNPIQAKAMLLPCLEPFKKLKSALLSYWSSSKTNVPLIGTNSVPNREAQFPIMHKLQLNIKLMLHIASPPSDDVNWPNNWMKSQRNRWKIKQRVKPVPKPFLNFNHLLEPYWPPTMGAKYLWQWGDPKGTLGQHRRGRKPIGALKPSSSGMNLAHIKLARTSKKFETSD